MLSRPLLPVLIALMLLPTVSASDDESAPLAIAYAVSHDTAWIILATQGEEDPAGSILPVCQGSQLQPGSIVHGTIQDDCLLPRTLNIAEDIRFPDSTFSAVIVEAGPCDPVGTTILGSEFPYVGAGVDWECVQATIDELAGGP